MDNPIRDVVAFLTKHGWTTAVFWLLLIASIAIAVYALSAIPEQRRPRHFAQWAVPAF